MSSNTIIIRKQEDPFSRVPWAVLNDTNLSWKAKGLLSYLLGKPDGWKVQTSDLVNKGSDGEESVRSGLKEIRDAHYGRLVCIKEKGMVKEWQFTVSDTPNLEPEPERKPIGTPDPGNPDGVKTDLSKNHCTKNESTKNESSFLQKDPPDLKAEKRVEPKPPIAPLKSEHSKFKEWWITAFPSKYNKPYIWSGRDAKALKDLLDAGMSVDDLAATVTRCWSGEGGFFGQRVNSVFALLSHINEIRVELDKSATVNGNGSSNWANVKLLEADRAILERKVAIMDDDWTKVYLRVEPLATRRKVAKEKLEAMNSEISGLYARIGGRK